MGRDSRIEFRVHVFSLGVFSTRAFIVSHMQTKILKLYFFDTRWNP